eukprot:TRINITY_DN5021_c0_g1_i1.p2 TRINITY_DN5021_c0_g1~~TRINITY_DN5021_c0_g1_i1.p2  ORF type:complete len:128 (-),score=28.90 TRINITY_DN5021_c0_g1_i1:461-844(-)
MKSLKLQRSYSAKNHVDENVSAVCLAVDSGLKKLFAGYNGFLQIFDLENSSHKFFKMQLKDEASNKFVKTIVSAIAIDPLNERQYAYGCYNKAINIGDVRTGTSFFPLDIVQDFCCLVGTQWRHNTP